MEQAAVEAQVLPCRRECHQHLALCTQPHAALGIRAALADHDRRPTHVGEVRDSGEVRVQCEAVRGALEPAWLIEYLLLCIPESYFDGPSAFWPMISSMPLGLSLPRVTPDV